MKLFVPNNVLDLEKIQTELDVVMDALHISRWTASYWIGGKYNKFCSRNTKTILFLLHNKKEKKMETRGIGWTRDPRPRYQMCFARTRRINLVLAWL